MLLERKEEEKGKYLKISIKQTGKDEVGKPVYLQHSNTQKIYFLYICFILFSFFNFSVSPVASMQYTCFSFIVGVFPGH